MKIRQETSLFKTLTGFQDMRKPQTIDNKRIAAIRRTEEVGFEPTNGGYPSPVFKTGVSSPQTQEEPTLNDSGVHALARRLALLIEETPEIGALIRACADLDAKALRQLLHLAKSMKR